jgi:uncharacterized protein
MNTSQNNSFIMRYGQWAVVTGASSGIGQAMAKELAQAGLNLVLVARRENELARLAQELSREHGVQAHALACDLAETNSANRIIAETEHLEVGLLVAAAGFGTSGEFLQANLDEEMAMLDVNCRAVLVLTLHYARRFAKIGRGGIVLFGSLVGFQGTPHAAHYAATKAYVQTLGEALHCELAPKGVDVLVSAPGPVHSGFAARARMVLSMAEKPETVARATTRALGKKMTVTPGLVSKLLTWSLMTAPRSLRVGLMGKIMGNMTRNLAK